MKFMILKNQLWIILISLVFIALSTLFFVIPSVGTEVFLSPDETAAAESARQFGSRGSMFIKEQILDDFSWLHPRSFVTRPGGMAPVGFLGLPVLLGALWKFFGEWVLVLFIPALALSVIYPLWRLLDGFSRQAKLLAVFLWLTFPTVILYANRGLFPNLPIVCLLIWSLALLKNKKNPFTAVLSGLLVGISLTIRPVEFFWIIPWIAYFLFFNNRLKKAITRKYYFIFFVSFLVPILWSLSAAWKTYGSPFVIGYWLRDPVELTIRENFAPKIQSIFPFGFHPRNVWFNVKNYLLGFLGPWTALAMGGLAVWFRRKKNIWPVVLSVWTAISLILFYGQSIYQDHVGFNIPSSGNSFLRYILPVTPIIILSIVFLWDWLENNYKKAKTESAVMLFIALFAFIGIWSVGGKDDENIFKSAAELQRYQIIKAASLALGRNTIVLSDRSDKIFFPDYLTASPLPSKDNILKLVQSADYPVLYFGTSASKDEIKNWNKEGLALLPLFRTQNQTLYKIIEFSMSLEP